MSHYHKFLVAGADKAGWVCDCGLDILTFREGRTGMAHMRELDHKCDNGCGKRAVVGVYNSHNTLYGEYCRPCGRERARRLQAEEEAGGRYRAARGEAPNG